MRTLLTLLAITSISVANGTLEVAGPVHLAGHRVHARIHDRVAEVAIEQTFTSAATRQLEGTYVFPLPDGATVSEFAMTMGGKMVKGQVMEKNKAKRIYEGIVAKKKDPGLLEKIDRGVFRARVFPIEPRSNLTIRIVYQQLLPEHDGTMEFRYPLARDRLRADDVRTVSIDIEMESTADLRTVYSPSHKVETLRKGPRVARVGWEGGRTAQDKDFLLYIGRGKDAVACSLVTHKAAAERGTFLALLSPLSKPKEDEILPKDVIYVLDTSGSMQGDKMKQAQAALKFGIGTLRKGDRFNVIAFSTEPVRFRDRLVDAGDDAKAAAQAFVAKLEANGGTALDDALQAALRMPTDDRLGIIVLLTDGLPSVGERDPRTIVKRVQSANKANARVFVFGVGFDQNVAFLDRITTLTRGAREYITPKQDLEVVVSRFCKRIDQPVLNDLRLDLGDGISEVYPRQLPDLFAGDQLVVMGRYETPGPRRIRLHGTLRGKPVTYVYEGTLAKNKEVAPLPRLWAERKVAYLVEQINVNGRNKELVDEVVRLGTKYSIVTEYTSGLVIEDDAIETEIPEAEIQARPIPTEEEADHNETDNDSEFEETMGDDGMSDTPFSGSLTGSAIGLGGGAGGGPRRRGGRNLRGGGGTGMTENAVELGLKWLSDHQSADTSGAWEASDCGTGPRSATDDTAATGMSLLAFLGAGYTDRGSARENQYAKNVRQGLRYLITIQDDEGCFAPRTHKRSVYNHAIATLAMCEAYWMTRNPRYKKPAQDGLDHLATLDWGKHTLFAVLALKSGKFAGLHLDFGALDRALRYFEQPPVTTDVERAGALLGRILLGEDPRGSKLKHLADALGTPTRDIEFLQLGTMAAFQCGGTVWRTWNEAMKKIVVDGQRKNASGKHAGSWDPIGEHDRIMTTAQMVLCMEVYYRYDRVFGLK